MIRLLGFCACIVILSGCGGPDAAPPVAPVTVAPSSTPPSSPPATVPPVAPAVEPKPTASTEGVTVITPEIMEKNLFTLQNLYPGQTLEVTGQIDSISAADEGRTMIFLKYGSKFSTAPCLLDEKETWARCYPGQTVTLRGKEGRLDAFTKRILWKVTSAVEQAAPILTSIALAKEFTDNDQQASARYAEQSFYLTGEIVSIEEEVCHLKTESATEIRVSLPADALLSPNPFLKTPAYKVGKPLTILAKYSPLLHEAGLVNLDGVQITVPFPVPGVQYAAAIPSASERMANVAKGVLAAKPEYTLSAKELVSEWRADKPATREKYENKIGELTGVIENFRTSADRNQDFLLLQLGENTLALSCYLVTSAPWKDYQIGQAVTVRGRFDGTLFPDFREVIVVKSEPATAPRLALSTEELVQKVAVAGEFTLDNWRGKEFLVTGKIHSIDLEDVLAPLKLDAGAAGVIHVDNWDDDHLKVIDLARRKPGEMLRVVGNVHGWSPEEKILEIDRAWILP